MDSINTNQPEQNRADLRGAEAIAKIRQLVEKAQTCFFCTHATSGESTGTRPMSVQQVDAAGHLWFLSANDSHKNQELAADSAVELFFQGSAHSAFLTLKGKATVTRDKDKIKELWEPIVKTWFTEGVDDPRITAIESASQEGYYWDTKHGIAIAGLKDGRGCGHRENARRLHRGNSSPLTAGHSGDDARESSDFARRRAFGPFHCRHDYSHYCYRWHLRQGVQRTYRTTLF